MQGSVRQTPQQSPRLTRNCISPGSVVGHMPRCNTKSCMLQRSAFGDVAARSRSGFTATRAMLGADFRQRAVGLASARLDVMRPLSSRHAGFIPSVPIGFRT